jgi:ABC-type multidrug transport system fused ATPase/permease subunit
MRTLPLEDPGTPDARSPARYLLWIIRGQWVSVAAGVIFGILWMGSQAFVPAAIGNAIDGVTDRDTGRLLLWTGGVLGLGAVTAAAGIFRHRVAVFNWLSAAYRTVQVAVRHTTRVGAALPRKIATGEVVAIGATDISHIGGAIEITARAAGSVVAFGIVAAILLRSSVTLGLIVLVGVPVLMLAISPLFRPLHRRQHTYREIGGKLTTRATDIVAGLRVLRGIGGEESFSARFKEESQRLRRAGLRVAKVDAALDGAQVLLPGIFVTIVTWLGARFALSGDISVGELVAFYGYAAFLVAPLRNATEAADKIIRGLVAAGRVTRLLALEPAVYDPDEPLAAPIPASPPDGVPLGSADRRVDADDRPVGDEYELVDAESGLKVRAGTLTAVAATDPADAAALADRLGRYVDADVEWRGVPLDRLRLATVRRHILLADGEARLFSGRLRDEIDVREASSDAAVMEALHAASAEDIIDGLADGLDEVVEERGRSLSGGQRQRLLLARALLFDPDVLVLVEPTSAVDAHTEARIAARLRAARAGRTTIVTTTSPLVLDRADEVAFVEDGKVAATGTHRQLLDTSRAYRSLVTRGEDQ